MKYTTAEIKSFIRDLELDISIIESNPTYQTEYWQHIREVYLSDIAKLRVLLQHD